MTDKVPASLINKDAIKKSLTVSDDFTLHDEKIDEIAADTNSAISLELTPFLDGTPIETNQKWYEAAIRAATHRAKGLYYEYVQQREKYDLNIELYREQIKALKAAITAERSTRTTTTLVSRSIASLPRSPSNLKGYSIYGNI